MMRALERKIPMSMKTDRSKFPALACTTLLCSGVTILAVGCAPSDPGRKYRTDLDSLSADLSPELVNISQTRDEARMDWVVNRDQDLRNAWTDLGRLWLTNKPRPTSPYPIMSTNGNP
jgi:hypothetical protein